MTFIEFAGAGSLWLYMLWYTWRLLRRSEVRPYSGSPMHSIWGLLMAACGTFTLRTIAVQESLDQMVANRMPLGQGLRSVSIIMAAWCYLRLLRHIHQTSPQIMSPRVKRFYVFGYNAPLWVVLTIACLLVFSVLGALSYIRAYYLIILSVDSVALPLIFFICIPINLRMIQLEKVPEMRVKQAATIVLCLLYALTAATFFLNNLAAAIEEKMYPQHSKGLIVLLAVFCIMLQFAPFKMIRFGLLPLSYNRYWHLLRLEQQVATLTAAVSRGMIWVKPAELENAYYTAIISLLDNVPVLPDDTAGHKLRQQVERVLHQHQDSRSLASTQREQSQ